MNTNTRHSPQKGFFCIGLALMPCRSARASTYHVSKSGSDNPDGSDFVLTKDMDGKERETRRNPERLSCS